MLRSLGVAFSSSIRAASGIGFRTVPNRIQARSLVTYERKMASKSSSFLTKRVSPFSHVLSGSVGDQRRHLNIHEYQSMDILDKYGIPHPKCGVASSAAEAEAIAQKLGSKDFVIKAMVLTGGRGKGRFKGGLQGGVHVTTCNKQLYDYANSMIGDRLVTKQSGPEGKPCSKVLVTERLYNRAEKYFAIMMDRESGGPVMIGSPMGGMDIEQVAQDSPQFIFKQPVDLIKGVTDAQLRRMAENLGFDSESTADQAVDVMKKLYKLFMEQDCTLLEINPISETHDGRVLCIDAKLNFDENALFRHPDLYGLKDSTQADPREVSAEKQGLNYIGLDGDIGCLVNGAGLAMATLDVLKLYGGNPANFLDLGGGASAAQVTAAFEILNKDPAVKCILVNIFGGIMRCDTIALGLIQAVTTLGMRKPLVVRLQGTNMEAANKLLEESGLRIMTAPDLGEASTKIVRIVKILDMAQEAQLQVDFTLPL